MSKRPANPNTKYGRKRLRDEYYERKASMNPEQQSNQTKNETILFVIVVVVIVGILFLFGGLEAVSKWFNH
jgi:hypothetical protein